MILRECYCAHQISPYSAPLDEIECGLSCSGRHAENCGGRLALSVYANSKKVKTGAGAKYFAVDSFLVFGMMMGVLLYLA